MTPMTPMFKDQRVNPHHRNLVIAGADVVPV